MGGLARTSVKEVLQSQLEIGKDGQLPHKGDQSSMTNGDITLRDVYLARKRASSLIRKTPLLEAPGLSESSGTQVSLKLENLQVTGSFKIRGATNKLRNLAEDARERGVITVSSGNHGRAVSYVARELGVPAVIVLSEAVPENKRKAIRDLGAEIVVGGKTYDEADERAIQLQKERGLTMVSPFDDLQVIAGQGTIGLELLEDLPDIDTVIVPLAGGGLIAGIAFALKTADPSILVEEPTLADALAGGLGADNIHTFSMVQKYVDDTALVSEEEIAGAMAFALEQHHLVVEGGGAVGIAAVMYDRIERLGKRVAVVVSGGNVDFPVLLDIAQNHSKESQ
jgi:threonine dehydratase